jgi:hypothetical protein
MALVFGEGLDITNIYNLVLPLPQSNGHSKLFASLPLPSLPQPSQQVALPPRPHL